MTSDEIREQFQSFFEQRDHLRQPSASLIPRSDPSTLLISAGMHPLKPYFTGREQPPHIRLTTCQKCFRTPDIDEVGLTKRHLTFFEMLGNFSIGDYFKQGAVEMAWEFSLEQLGFDPERIWITIFEGDDALGLGPDEEAIEAWLAVGVPRERIVRCRARRTSGRRARPARAARARSSTTTAGSSSAAEDDLPGGDNERFLEYWNLVFMQYDQEPEGVLTPLPAQNIDTGLGLERMAMLQQGTDSVYETDNFLPLIELGEQPQRRAPTTQDADTDRALRILADHSRGMSFLIADGVVPSNEDRGYVLRRIMRRAILQGRRIGIEPGFLPQVRGGRARAHERRLPRADRAGGHHRHVARARGGGVRPDARAGHAHPPGAHRRARRRRATRGSARPRPSSSTTPTASRSTSRSSSPPSRALASTRRASRT